MSLSYVSDLSLDYSFVIARSDTTWQSSKPGFMDCRASLAMTDVGLATTDVELATTDVELAMNDVELATTDVGLATAEVGRKPRRELSPSGCLPRADFCVPTA